MFRALPAFTGSACFVVVAAVAGFVLPAPALAAGKVVIEQFDGSGAAGFRNQVKKALGELGVDVVTDKKLAATEADLGLMQASDSYAAVAKQVGATHFIRGTVKGKKPTATLTVKNSDGKKAGQKTFTGKNASQLTATLDKQLKKVLADILDVGAGGAVAEAKDDKQEDKKEAKKEEKKAAKAEAKEAKEEKAAEKKSAKAEADDEEEEEEDAADAKANTADVSASAKREEPSDNGKSVGWKGLDVAFGTFIYNREFAYNANKKGGQQAYKTSPVAPAVTLALEYFITRNIGLAAGGEMTVGLSSARDNTTFATSSMGFYGGPKAKMHFGGLEVNLLAAYAKHSFTLAEKVGSVTSDVPAADYGMVRAVLGARYDLGAVAVFGTFGYDHVLDMGAFTKAFPNATAAGTEGSAGLIVPLAFLMSGLDVRAAFYARSFGIAMNSKADDSNVAGGATDSYTGAMISAGYRTN